MAKYTAVNGTNFTDQDIERWATEAASEDSYRGGHIGPSVPGRPVSAGGQVKPFTL